MDRAVTVPVDLIQPDPDQPRRTFDEALLQDLATSIGRVGIVIPLIVRDTGDDGFVLIDGERRWRASRIAGIAEIPVLIRADEPEHPSTHIQQIVAAQRVDLSAMERARAYARALRDGGLSVEDLAESIGVAKATISEYVGLTDLPDSLQELVDQGLPVRGALALRSLAPDRALALASAAVTHGWSAQRIQLEVSKATPRPPVPPTMRKAAIGLQTVLRGALKLPVKVTPTAKGGATISITTRNQADTDRLRTLLGASTEGA